MTCSRLSLTHVPLLTLVALLLVPSLASAYHVRVSVKFLLDANGNRPATGTMNTNSEVYQQILRANSVLCNSGSDMRVVLTEIVDINGLPGLSSWPCSSKESLEFIAKTQPSAFAWRSNAVNVYITGVMCGGKCSFWANDIIMLGQTAGQTTLIHELGHYFGLYHTHGKYCDGNATCTGCYFDDDGLTDTLLDAPCWSANDISGVNYSKPYAALSSSQKKKVDQTFGNMMSYHGNRTVFTPQQEALLSVTAFVLRSSVLNARGDGPCFKLFGGRRSASPEDAAERLDYETSIVEIPEEIAAYLDSLLGGEEVEAIFLPGDVDSNSVVDIQDSLALLQFLYAGGFEPECEDAADMNDDGALSISDSVAILSSVVLGRPTPRGLPVGFPAVDKTSDNLHCSLNQEEVVD